MTEFSEAVVAVIRSIPAGKVASYGDIAREAGNPRAARQVSRLLHSLTAKYNLPWYRVINSKGSISLSGSGFEQQKHLLEEEGVVVSDDGQIDLKVYKYFW